MRFFISQNDLTVIRMFIDRGWTRTLSLKNTDLVVFPGGPDITPFLYGEKKLSWTHSEYKRDLDEVRLFYHLPRYLAKVGICRGGQLLNVLSGGRIWQHVTNHSKKHIVKVLWGNRTDDLIEVSSAHHQMMIPSENAQILSAAKVSTQKYCDGVEKKYTYQERFDIWDDAEAIYYWETMSLCFQSHPEWQTGEEQDLFFEMLELVLPTKKKNETVQEVQTG